jgi:hypothetical protein
MAVQDETTKEEPNEVDVLINTIFPHRRETKDDEIEKE